MTVLRYTDRAAFLHAVKSLGYHEEASADDLDSDVTDAESHLVGGWWQADGYPNPMRWEGELASEGADEWLRHTHAYEGPDETEMHDWITRQEAGS